MGLLGLYITPTVHMSHQLTTRFVSTVARSLGPGKLPQEISLHLHATQDEIGTPLARRQITAPPNRRQG